MYNKAIYIENIITLIKDELDNYPEELLKQIYACMSGADLLTTLIELEGNNSPLGKAFALYESKGQQIDV